MNSHMDENGLNISQIQISIFKDHQIISLEGVTDIHSKVNDG